jgi:hypothetical protein
LPVAALAFLPPFGDLSVFESEFEEPDEPISSSCACLSDVFAVGQISVFVFEEALEVFLVSEVSDAPGVEDGVFCEFEVSVGDFFVSVEVAVCVFESE